jgi:hypothetical protein
VLVVKVKVKSKSEKNKIRNSSQEAKGFEEPNKLLMDVER